jgi:catalase
MVSREKSGTTDSAAPLDDVRGKAQQVVEQPGVTPSQMLQKAMAATALAAAMPNNPNKPGEYGEASRTPQAGAVHTPENPAATASTLTETNASPKTGSGKPVPGNGVGAGNLDRVRTNGSGQRLTTNQGVPIADNQNSLKIGLRGPTALEDFILREKITHFDHERIPERVVHARGSGAHGYFECYRVLSDLTQAAPFAEAGKRTPLFVRFSTVAGERGSADTVRDVRGFAVKFYTEEGNWDLVGNNMPVFFIQDAMKFPDLIHAVKPEPHNGMPQAASAHDTFWDFASLMPEITHMLMWHTSDRAIPRSYRMMQGFGVHTFRLVNAEGASVLCKFHWNPVAGTHSLVWDEAVKISGADPDFHRRDLWDAIEAGIYPEWELGLQVFSEEQAAHFGFDVLDATKLVPEELVPVIAVGKMVLNRNPDNFFSETEQVAFCTAHVIPGIDFTNDPLLQGRIHSYIDTQISRLGGPNFHEIPINAPLAPLHNNQRDGMHRQAIHRGGAAYEPNSLAGGCPFQAGMRGFTSFPQTIAEDKVRGKAELFADHYSQARLFLQSQTSAEQRHMVAAFRFELTRVQNAAVRSRVVSMLLNVDTAFATAVAHGLGLSTLPAPMPLASTLPIPTYASSPSLSLLHRPGDGAIHARRVALLVADGVDGALVAQMHAALTADKAMPYFIARRLGQVRSLQGAMVTPVVSFETTPSVLYDAVIIPDGKEAVDQWCADAHVLDFVREQYRHGKPILALGRGALVLEKAGIAAQLPNHEKDCALIVTDVDRLTSALLMFTSALAGPRTTLREAVNLDR